MREIRIPKGNGMFRVVHSCTTYEERRRYKRLAKNLARYERLAARQAGVSDVSHGFIAGRSPVTCALVHRSFALSVCCDISGWYDHVRPEQILAGLRLAGLEEGEAARLANLACIVGSPECPRPGERAPRQGLHSSPAAANLAGVLLDRAILDGLEKLGLPFSYTRYADDLTCSLQDDSREVADRVFGIIDGACEEMGWRLAPSKTRFQRAKAGRRVIVGISVGEDIRATRRHSRLLRSLRHQGEKKRSGGLEEWCKLKLPLSTAIWREVLCVLSATDPLSMMVAADLFEEHGRPGLARYCRRFTVGSENEANSRKEVRLRRLENRRQKLLAYTRRKM